MKRVPPYIPPGGTCKIAFVGEAPGRNEVRKGEPLVGFSGRELNKLLKIAGIDRHSCLITNVFDFQLPDNDLGQLSISAKEVEKLVDIEDPFAEWSLTYHQRGQYVPPDVCYPALARLKAELEAARPNIVVALGQTALWALMCGGSITKERGHLMDSALVPGLKVLPTFHPAYVGRVYKTRITMLTDLRKVVKQQDSPKIIMPKRELWLNPGLEDLADFKHAYMEDAAYVAVDIETYRGQVECIGFAPDPLHAIVVPLIDRVNGGSYWSDNYSEAIALDWCQHILEDRSLPKLMQNGPYDVQWIWEKLRIKTYNYSEDTRLLHHALYPELPKSLQYLGSNYENEQAWKTLRGAKDFKRDA